jgi:hypothetical protein
MSRTVRPVRGRVDVGAAVTNVQAFVGVGVGVGDVAQIHFVLSEIPNVTDIIEKSQSKINKTPSE